MMKSTKPPPMITDWDVYRKRHGLKKNTKIFICKEYYHFKKALLARDWVENTDYESPIFHMKFTVKAKDIYQMQKGTAQNMKGDSNFELQDF